MTTAKENYRTLIRSYICPHFEENKWDRSGYLCQYKDTITGNELGLDIKTYGPSNDDRLVMWFYLSIFPLGLLELANSKEPADVSDYVVPFDGAAPVGQLEKNIFWELRKDDDVKKLAKDILERLDMFFNTHIGPQGERFKEIVENLNEGRQLEGSFFTNQSSRRFSASGVDYSIISLSDEIHGNVS